jgi:hypothetical protein
LAVNVPVVGAVRIVMPFKFHRNGRHHIPRQKFRVANWPDYEAALRNRGSLTIWFTAEAIAYWRAQPRATPGGQRHYSDLAIETALTLRAVGDGPSQHQRMHSAPLCSERRSRARAPSRRAAGIRARGHQRRGRTSRWRPSAASSSQASAASTGVRPRDASGSQGYSHLSSMVWACDCLSWCPGVLADLVCYECNPIPGLLK